MNLDGAFGVVGVFYGGTSSERAVSLKSGEAVYAALRKCGVESLLIDTRDEESLQNIIEKIDRAMIMLHGRGGEDGTLQGMLHTLDIPFTGSDVGACALAMDKWRAKLIFEASHIPTPGFVSLKSSDELVSAEQRIGLPLIVKPCREGSTIGITKVTNPGEISAAYELARTHDAAVIAEKFIDGQELTVAVLNQEALPVVRIKAPNNQYDYHAKYQSDATEYFCPTGLGDNVESNVQAVALRAFEAIGCSGWGRVDIILDRDEVPWVLEVNTVPGMTSHSLVPMAAAAAGIKFEDLVIEILRSSDVA